MFLAVIEPSDQDDYDPRPFECRIFLYSETVLVNSGALGRSL